MHHERQRRAAPAVEEPESRQLLSVTVTPGRVNLRSIEHGHGAFHVRVVSDTTTTADLLRPGTPLVLTLTDKTGKVVTLTRPERTVSEDVNHDGVADQSLKFRRSELKGLAAGDVTVKVSAGQTGGTTAGDEGHFTIFTPGGDRHRGEHHRGEHHRSEHHGDGHTSGEHGHGRGHSHGHGNKRDG